MQIINDQDIYRRFIEQEITCFIGDFLKKNKGVLFKSYAQLADRYGYDYRRFHTYVVGTTVITKALLVQLVVDMKIPIHEFKIDQDKFYDFKKKYKKKLKKSSKIKE